MVSMWDIYVDGSYVYRQFPVKSIKKIKRYIDVEDKFIVYLREDNVMIWQDIESIESVGGTKKQEQIKKVEKIQEISKLIVDLNNLDTYFKKRKDLKEKHTQGFLKLSEHLSNWKFKCQYYFYIL